MGERERQVSRQFEHSSQSLMFCSRGCQTATHTILFRLWQPPTADIQLDDLSKRWLCQTCRQVPRVRAMQTNGCQSLTTFRGCFDESGMTLWSVSICYYRSILQSCASTLVFANKIVVLYLEDLSKILCFSPQHLPASTVCLQSQLWFTELLTTPSERWHSLDPWRLLGCWHWLKAGPKAKLNSVAWDSFLTSQQSRFCLLCWFAGMRDEFKRASSDVNTLQSKAKAARVMMESGGGSVWSFLQDHVDFVGNQLKLSQDPQDAATTQWKNGEKNLFDETLAECGILSLAQKLSEIENFWNVVILLSFMAFVVASVCLCAQVNGIAAKAIGGFIVAIGFVCLVMPGVSGIMFSKVLKECHGNILLFKNYDGVAICYKKGTGILSIGVAMMTAVTGLLLVKAGIAKGQGIQQTPMDGNSIAWLYQRFFM